MICEYFRTKQSFWLGSVTKRRPRNPTRIVPSFAYALIVIVMIDDDEKDRIKESRHGKDDGNLLVSDDGAD